MELNTWEQGALNIYFACVCVLVAQSRLILCDPMDCSPPGSSSHGILQDPLPMEFSRQEYWSGLPFPPPGDLPDPGIKPKAPALQADSLPSEPPGKPLFFIRYPKYEVDTGEQGYVQSVSFRFCCLGDPWKEL